MITWSGKSALVVGIGLILGTNTIALGGAAYNRSEPERTLRLSERELQPAGDSGGKRENSGMALILRWRTLAEPSGRGEDHGASYASYMGTPKWLDRSKLAMLGFDLPPDTESREPWSDVVPAKEVFLVLELNGASYQTALERARDYAAQTEALNTTTGSTNEYLERAKSARAQLIREENEYSRLFIIDAGLDAGALRARYSDAARYAIVRGQVRPWWIKRAAGSTTLGGYISGVSVDHINVPHALRQSPVFARRGQSSNPYSQLAPAEITVAFGRRLEPWITAVAQR